MIVKVTSLTSPVTPPAARTGMPRRLNMRNDHHFAPESGERAGGAVEPKILAYESLNAT
jgi:hypothetical protein